MRAVRMPRLYYGWVLVLALGLTETVSYGILSYSFPVFIAPMGAELGWSKAAITGAFSVALLTSGVVAIPLGRWVDRHGARAVMTAGSALDTVVLLLWSRVEGLAAFYLLALALGVAMAAVLYEPAFAVVANWFVELRGRALTMLTFMGGFASVVFVPLTTALVAGQGWRNALLWLAGILALLTIPLHALLLRRRPEDLGLEVDGGLHNASTASSRILRPRTVPSTQPSTTAHQAVRSASFRWLAAAFGLTALTTVGVAVHLIPLLLERGFSMGFAGAAMGMVGMMALPGRLIFTPLGSRWPRSVVTASIFALSALGLGIIRGTGGAYGVWTFVALFGAGFGAITPARAALLAEFYGREHYASISGVLALVVALSGAAAPIGLSALYRVAGGYDAVLWALLVISLLSGSAVLRAGMAEAKVQPGPAQPSPH
jgi:MFS family permease